MSDHELTERSSPTNASSHGANSSPPAASADGPCAGSIPYARLAVVLLPHEHARMVMAVRNDLSSRVGPALADLRPTPFAAHLR